jgi:hypothetical protein
MFDVVTALTAADTVSVVVRNPVAVTESLYWPGFTRGKRNAPVEPVLAVCVEPVSTLLRVTVAPETTAPDGSVTVPTTSPVNIDCAAK